MGNLDERAETIRIGNLAKDVLENEALQLAFQGAANDMFAKFLATHADEDEVRTKIWATGQSLDAIRKRLLVMAENGQMEKDNKSYDDN